MSHLIWLGLAALALQVDELLHSRLDEDVVTAARPLLKAESPKEVAQISEPDVRVRSTPENPPQELLLPCHRAILPEELFDGRDAASA